MASPTRRSSPSPTLSSSSPSSQCPPLHDVEQTQDVPRNWSELPPELLITILLRLGAIQILTTARLVCRAWQKVCKDPSMWRSIDMHNPADLGDMDYDLEIMCRNAVDRSQGGLLDINVEYFGTDSLLKYIADRSSNLRRLRLVCCYSITDEGLIAAATKLPLLEELEISYCSVSEEALGVVGLACSVLNTLKLNCSGTKQPGTLWDEDALAIARTMPQLHHLQLFGNRLTEIGLIKILDNCPLLEHLDLRQCFNVELDENLKKRCIEQIKTLRLPNDPTDDYEFDAAIHDWISSEEDYPYGFPDMDLVSDDDNSYEFSGASDIDDSDHDEDILL